MEEVVPWSCHDVNSEFPLHLYTQVRANICGLRVLHPEMTTAPGSLDWQKQSGVRRHAPLTIHYALLAQELLSVGLQGSGVLDPRFSLCIPQVRW